MTPGQARELLEVDENVTADALRRAYLRKIKQHKPERDPTGFQRCREAYDLLTRWLPVEGATTGPEPEPADDGDEVEAPPQPRPAPVVVPAIDDAAISWLERADQEPDVDARIALLSEAVDTLPMDTSLVLELEGELRAAGSPERALAVLRRAIARGVAGVETRLFAAHAARLDDDELSRLRITRPPGYRQALVTALLSRERADEASAVVEKALSTPGAGVIEWIAPALSFYEHAELTAAERVTDALRARIDAQQSGTKLQPHIRLRMILLFELATVARRLPEAVTTAIARGLRLGDLRGTEADLADFAATSRQRADALNALEEDAPALAGRFGAMLAPPVRRTPAGAGGAMSRWFVGALVLAIIRLAGSTCQETSRDHGRFVGAPTAPTISTAVVEVVTTRGAPPVLCVGDVRTCRALGRLSNALDAGRCLEVEALRLTVQRTHAELTRPRRDLDRLVDEMEARTLMECSASSWATEPAHDAEPPEPFGIEEAPSGVIWEDDRADVPAAVR